MSDFLLGILGIIAYCVMSAVGFVLWLIPVAIGFWIIRLAFNLIF